LKVVLSFYDESSLFSDSITGATSAIEAGMTVILVPLKHFNSVDMNKQIDELRPKLAAVLGSLTEFQPHEYGLPPFN
jgi:beta-phosphoglucomutase-like phosphatase (HAD superfamily)